MKPSDLKPPFVWDQRRPLIEEGIFYVPKSYEHQFDDSFVKSLFQKEQPICLEYCSGNGNWIAEKAAAHPDKNWLAVEMRFDRARKIWSKVKNLKLDNLKIVCGEGFTFTHFYLSHNFIDAIYINFPDPWPKRRHERHRIINQNFLKELSRVLKKEGKVTFVTDDKEYLEKTLQHFQKSPSFAFIEKNPYYLLDLPGYGSSFFEELWREKGKEIMYLQVVNNE